MVCLQLLHLWYTQCSVPCLLDAPLFFHFRQVRDAGNLLTRAGFALPTVDVDTFSMRYDTAAQLVQHLRVMGESSALINKKAGLKRDTALAAAAAYEGMFAEEDGSVPATYQVRGGMVVMTMSVPWAHRA